MNELKLDSKLESCPLCRVQLYACKIEDGYRFAHEANGCPNSRIFVRGEEQREAWNRLEGVAPRVEGYMQVQATKNPCAEITLGSPSRGYNPISQADLEKYFYSFRRWARKAGR